MRSSSSVVHPEAGFQEVLAAVSAAVAAVGTTESLAVLASAAIEIVVAAAEGMMEKIAVIGRNEDTAAAVNTDNQLEVLPQVSLALEHVDSVWVERLGGLTGQPRVLIYLKEWVELSKVLSASLRRRLVL